MVELCELKLMSAGAGDCWPPDIDEHVAQLDFADDPLHSSSAMGQSSVFNSIVLDPSIISTDSLMDMDTFRRRCETNKNDYKLTNFEDSGQWTTTSAIGTSINPQQRQHIYEVDDSSIGEPWATSSPLLNTRRSLVLRRLQHAQRTTDLGQDQDAPTAGEDTLLNGNNHLGLALLEQLNELEAELGEMEAPERREARRKAILDNVLNHNCAGTEGGMQTATGLTTWGRLQSGDCPPALDEKTYSLPELNDYNRRQSALGSQQQRPATTLATSDNVTTADRLLLPAPPPPPKPTSSSSTGSGRRPASLLANFVEHQQLSREGAPAGLWSEQHSSPQQQQQDYEYTEVYVGDGRYVDVNENEIGFVPQSTAPIQRSVDRWRVHRTQPPQPSNSGIYHYGGGSRYAQAALTVPAPPSRPTQSIDGSPRARTFADLSPSHTAPDLKFLSLSHKVPNLCRSSASLDGMLKKARQGAYLTDFNLEDERQLLFDGTQCAMTASSTHAAKDSGLGSCSSSGPSHIEDWPSLSILLPRHVVDACSFFKSNASLLTGSSAASSSNNNIERKLSARQEAASACRTCFCVRRHHCVQPPAWARPSTAHARLATTCDCATAETCCTTTKQLWSLGGNREGKRTNSNRLRLHAQELSIVGLPIYAIKRQLVERVVEGVAEIARGASSMVLLGALERLLADGLSDGFRPWNVIVEITGPGPATNTIFQLVKTLEASEKPENSRVDSFFRELLRLNSLDGWLSYVALKENVLSRLYADTAFLLRANTAYRSLFWRIIESIELLSVLTQCNGKGNAAWMSTSQPSSARWWGPASRLPSDSRVPKSSSVPARLTGPFNKVKGATSDGEQGSRVESDVEIKEEAIPLEGSNRSTTTPLRCSKIPVVVRDSPTSSYGERVRSRSTFNRSNGLLSPDSPARSRSLLRPSNADSLQTSNSRLSRIPVRVSPISIGLL